jgi:hypothetical protein
MRSSPSTAVGKYSTSGLLSSWCSPHSYVFQPENAVPIGTFIDEKDDVELLDILPVLLDVAPEQVRQLEHDFKDCILGLALCAAHHSRVITAASSHYQHYDLYKH